MKPENTKTLLHFVFDQMNQLDEGLISVEQVKQQSNLIRNATDIFKVENDIARVKMELTKHNKNFSDNIVLRNIETD